MIKTKNRSRLKGFYFCNLNLIQITKQNEFRLIEILKQVQNDRNSTFLDDLFLQKYKRLILSYHSYG